MSNIKNDDLANVLSEVARRASVDPDFRALALKDASAAIKKASAMPLPPDLDIQFVDNSGRTKYVPLPDPIPGLEELSEAELEAIAGGDEGVGVGGTSGPGGGTVSGSGTWHR